MSSVIEIISSIERRRRWTPEQKVVILNDAFRPGGSVAAASDAHGVSRALIYLWRRQAREGHIAGVGMAEPERGMSLRSRWRPSPIRLLRHPRHRDGERPRANAVRPAVSRSR